MTPLQEIRGSISEVDSKILTLLKRRLELTHQVGEYKAENNIEIFDSVRENEILANIRDSFPEDVDGIESLWRELMYISKRDQQRCFPKNKSTRIGVVGSTGAIDDMAIRQFLENTPSLVSSRNYETLYFERSDAILEALNNGSIDYGQLPLVNPLSGIVMETITQLGKYRWQYIADSTYESESGDSRSTTFILLSL